jgi:hypothetical protein
VCSPSVLPELEREGGRERRRGGDREAGGGSEEGGRWIK